VTDARVVLWSRDIGAVSWLEERQIGVFQYAPEFVRSGIEVAPLTMPLRTDPYEFPNLSRDTYRGLPGFLADSLPDKFGNAVIDTWLARQGRLPGSFNPVERLCYTGTRGIGALEFFPLIGTRSDKEQTIEIKALVALANEVLDERGKVHGMLATTKEQVIKQADALKQLLHVGTSAGGARAKAIVAWNQTSGEFRSGQLSAPEGFNHWLIKFDGVHGNADKELADPQGFGVVEYAYYLMALAAGITMAPCRLHQEGGRSHFMTRRFDRTVTGGKLHMQSLCAMKHFDFNLAGAWSYEEALQTIRQLRLPMKDIEEQFKRCLFNVLARNQDDHAKNIAFLMDKNGQWRLSPAYDLTHAFNPDGAWTSRHQMSINGKLDGFVTEDLVALAAIGGIKESKARRQVQALGEVVARWGDFAGEAGVDPETASDIGSTHRRLA